MVLDFIGIGSIAMDIIKTTEGMFTSYGGPAVNTAAILQKLGLMTGIIARVGNDPYGEQCLRELQDLGVDTSCVTIDTETPTTIAHIDARYGDRKIEKIDFLKRLDTFTEEQKSYIKSAKSVLIGPRLPAFEQYGHFAKENNIITYITLHMSALDNKLLAFLEEIRPKAVLGNEKEIVGIQNMLEDVVFIVTRGEGGATVYSHNKGKNYPTFKVNAVDTTAAGDAFCAGYIYGEFNGWGIDRTMVFANAIGALATQRIGSKNKLYTAKEVEQFIKTAPPYS